MVVRSSRKTVGGSKVLHSRNGREKVANVFRFMKIEAESGETINLNKVKEHVVEASRISGGPLKWIMKEE